MENEKEVLKLACLSENAFNVVVSEFQLKDVLNVSRYGDGHINDTYLFTCKSGDYIVQRISKAAFKNIPALMKNIELVTDYCTNKCLQAGGDPKQEVLRLVKTKDGAPYFDYKDCSFRAYDFIKGAISLNAVSNSNEFFEVGFAFGKYITMLDGFDATTLSETIKDFHNTPVRYETFLKAVKEDKFDRVKLAAKEIEWVKSKSYLVSLLTDLLKSGNLPLRVVHNDTKLNNLLVCEKTKKGLAVIDLDTVMPGSICYDFGDGIRSGCNTGAEDEIDLTKVNFNEELFEAFAKGFIKGTKTVITDTEKANLVNGAIVITLECGIRFLTDFLSGDVYFRTHRENQNLHRARTQFKLVDEMERLSNKLNEFVKSVI